MIAYYYVTCRVPRNCSYALKRKPYRDTKFLQRSPGRPKFIESPVIHDVFRDKYHCLASCLFWTRKVKLEMRVDDEQKTERKVPALPDSGDASIWMELRTKCYRVTLKVFWQSTTKPQETWRLCKFTLSFNVNLIRYVIVKMGIFGLSLTQTRISFLSTKNDSRNSRLFQTCGRHKGMMYRLHNTSCVE